jgi:hypothetical protein
MGMNFLPVLLELPAHTDIGVAERDVLIRN